MFSELQLFALQRLQLFSGDSWFSKCRCNQLNYKSKSNRFVKHNTLYARLSICVLHHNIEKLQKTAKCASAQLVVGGAVPLCRWLHSQVAAGPEVGQLRLAMEEGERNNVATFYFTHQEKGEEVAEEEDEGGTASDAENGNQMENKKVVKRVLHYSTEDIHLLATQVYAGDGTPGTVVQGLYNKPPGTMAKVSPRFPNTMLLQ